MGKEPYHEHGYLGLDITLQAADPTAGLHENSCLGFFASVQVPISSVTLLGT